jgi:Glyoxalase-like domain
MNHVTEDSVGRIARRKLLQLGIGLINMRPLLFDAGRVTKALAYSFHKAMPLAPAKFVLDHVLLGVAELEDGIAWVEKKTGVKAAYGGSHPGAGTHNALLSLGDRQYLEIIAPDPNQKSIGALVPLLKEFPIPKPFSWVATTRGIELLANKLRGAGLNIDGPQSGSRMRPDGRWLQWKTIRLSGQPYGLIPFFIEWASDTIHPSVDSPSGCQLADLELYHPEPNRTSQMMMKWASQPRSSRLPNLL